MNITTQFLEKYNKQGPRYTSYPPATSFHNQFTKDDLIKSIISSNKEKPENISIYIHIPFCPQRCYFCGCNTTESTSEENIRKYIDSVKKEIDSFAQHIDKSREVTQIHFGGGTPNSIKFEYLNEVLDKIKSHFTLADNCENSIECSPAYLEFEDVDKLAEMGLNRISLGIQDFHDDVLRTINRKPSKHPLNELVNRIRQNRFKGINFDLVYGLPHQTLNSFKENIEKTIELSPDRIATFSFAHVPWVNKLQKNLDSHRLPAPEEKLSMLVLTINMLTQNGYDFIGMDHFAKPTDELSIAQKEKTLHRNFQGYCTKQATGQVYAFGASSISQQWNSYSQNVKTIHEYIDNINKEGFAVERGYTLTKEETIIREVINEIMCNGYLNFAELAGRLNTSADNIKKVTAYNPSKLKEFEADSLIEINNDIIRVSSDGMLVVRNIAMTFDPDLKIEDSQFSKTV